uniref:Flavin-containing monooxygenase n=1 Tax=Anopheles atroparvus TaxID=41427 RepID=A0A182IWY2_ANOAO
LGWRDIFRGRQLHSKDYRRSEHYSGERVLIVGGGHSGVDIAPDVASHARRAVLSHRCKGAVHTGDQVVQKPEISRLTPTGAIFVDGCTEDFDVIIYCTGYRYSVPFISMDCGVTLHNNAISPLYYHCININQPTMAFIGLPFNACLMLMMDMQARFCLQFYSGQKPLPSREEMLEEWKRDTSEREARGLTGKLTHMLAGDLQQRYYDELARIAQIESLKPVLAKMHADCITSKNEDVNFRSYEYHVIDDENFTKVKIPHSNNAAALA